MEICRRHFVRAILAAPVALSSATAWASASTLRRVRGMLWGSLIGDAAGGPVEFKSPSDVRGWLPSTRDWQNDRRLNAEELDRLAAGFRLLPYKELRPQPAPYAHWLRDAAPGTVTDDTRHKFFLVAALRRAKSQAGLPIGTSELAAEYLRYEQSEVLTAHPGYAALCEEWLREYNQAARWMTGDRNAETAAPPERLWGGVPTNAGQMALLPLAAAFAGQPIDAYRAAFSLAYIDNGTAKDLNSAVVAGLAAAIGRPGDESPRDTWQIMRQAMLTTDPYRYGGIPWVERPLARWLAFAEEAASRAEGSPKKLFSILEDEGKPRFHWDAHFVVASSWAILALANFNPLAAMQLSLDFGHDTDSAAQLVGAFAGAVHGEELFPAAMREQVGERLVADYAESVEEWAQLLASLQDRQRYPVLVK